MTSLPPQLRPTLHRAWCARIAAEWRRLNRNRLGGALREPAFAIDVVGGRVGRWQSAGRILSVSEVHVLTAPWAEVVETIGHEMAHQVVAELGGGLDDGPHGAAFAAACARLGVSARASAPAVKDADSERMLARVHKLLALAESANVHEAESAMAHANRLLLAHNLDLARLGERRGYVARTVGQAHARVGLGAKLIGCILRDFFFVECLWIGTYDAIGDRNLTQLEIMGEPTNVELAHYVHDFLHAALERLWRGARTDLGRGDVATRRAFIGGVLTGFSDKLRAERRAQAERGLVWVGDRDLKDWYRARHPRIAALPSAGWSAGQAHDAGRRAGGELRLHRGIGSHGADGGLLGAS